MLIDLEALLMRGGWETRKTKSLELRTRLSLCHRAMDSREGSGEIGDEAEVDAEVDKCISPHLSHPRHGRGNGGTLH